MRLIDLATGQPLTPGDRVSTFRGEVGVLNSARPPAHVGSTGRVFVTLDGTSFQREWFPHVINAKWVDGEDVP